MNNIKMNNKFSPSWLNKGKQFMLPKINELSNGERLEMHRNEIAEILKENCASLYDRDYYNDLKYEIEEDLDTIYEYLNNDNIRLRNNYLNDKLNRCNKIITNKIDYDIKIKECEDKIKSNDLKISQIFDEISKLSEKLSEIKKTKPFVFNPKKQTYSPEEIQINNRLEKIPFEKNNLEEENLNLEKSIENYINIKEEQEIEIKNAESYKLYINENWEKYSHNGLMIVLPN